MEKPETDRIAEIAESHDLKRRTVREVVEDLQIGAEKPQVCEECGRTANAEANRYVDRVPLGETVTGVRCAECYTDHVDDETELSTRESEAVAYLLVSDLTHSDISSLTGMGTVSNYRTRAIEKYEQAQNSPDSGPLVPIMEVLLYE